MSNAAQLAREEAARAETEEPDENTPPAPVEPDENTPPEPVEPDESAPAAAPPAPPAALTENEIEKRYDRAGKLATRYVGQLQTALGVLFDDLVPSPLDVLPGFVMTDQAGNVDPAVRDATLDFLRVNVGPDYRPHPDRQTCELCDGWGDVASGARRPGNELLQCPRCGGFGYTDKSGASVVAGNAPPAPLVNGAPTIPADVPHAPDDPRVAQLRALGFTVLEPLTMGA